MGMARVPGWGSQLGRVSFVLVSFWLAPCRACALFPFFRILPVVSLDHKFCGRTALASWWFGRVSLTEGGVVEETYRRRGGPSMQQSLVGLRGPLAARFERGRINQIILTFESTASHCTGSSHVCWSVQQQGTAPVQRCPANQGFLFPSPHLLRKLPADPARTRQLG
jgi:hypothetical protein